MKNTLTLIKDRVGHGSVRRFVREELGTTYRTFVYQLKHGLVPYRQIRVIINKLDISFDDFKDYNLSEDIKVHSQKEKNTKREVARSLRDLDIPKPRSLSELILNK